MVRERPQILLHRDDAALHGVLLLKDCTCVRLCRVPLACAVDNLAEAVQACNVCMSS
jgi:hypothetical protein